MTTNTTPAPAARECYGKPVRPVAIPANLDGLVQVEVPMVLTPSSTGVIVHAEDRAPRVSVCDWATTDGRTPASYRDETLVPFFAYYTSTTRVEVFGPDLEV